MPTGRPIAPLSLGLKSARRWKVGRAGPRARRRGPTRTDCPGMRQRQPQHGGCKRSLFHSDSNSPCARHSIRRRRRISSSYGARGPRPLAKKYLGEPFPCERGDIADATRHRLST